MYEIRQDYLEYIIKKCHCGGMFPSVVLTQKDEKLFSIQREDSGRSLRMFKWNNFADDQIIPGHNGIGSVQIDVMKFLRAFKVLKAEKSYIEFLPGIETVQRLTIEGEQEQSDIREIQKEMPYDNYNKLNREIEMLKTKSKKKGKQKEITLKEQEMENLQKQMDEIVEKITKMQKRKIKRTHHVEIPSGGKFHIINGKKELFMNYREPEKEVMMALTFPIEKGVPLVGKERVPLDTYVRIDVSDIKEVCNNMSAIESEFATFELSNNFSITAGDLHDTSDKIRLVIDCSYSGPKNVSAIYTYGFKVRIPPVY